MRHSHLIARLCHATLRAPRLATVRGVAALLVFSLCIVAHTAGAQPLGQADRGAPGDEMIQRYLARETARLNAGWDDDLKSADAWRAREPQLREQLFYMLGLWPLPERTPLHAKVTGRVESAGGEMGGGKSGDKSGNEGRGKGADKSVVVENLHYQSRPGLYVTANLYRPSGPTTTRRPAVLYVCGHSGRGRDGNKTAFQSHGLWLARHGYVCLIVDTLQLGELAATHHGTYNLERWWWHSRGYTSAGVECWNGVRGVDYLISRDDVDPERIAVTGISGGGAATFWVAAADPRVKVAVPVSGMADLDAYVPNRVINGHCDCMFLHNSFRWPWTRIAALVAPRPMLFVNSDKDAIFPMDANERITNRMERFYSLFGAGDRFDTLVSVGGHDYRADIRQGVFRFLNSHLKHDAREVTDAEVDLVDDRARTHPIPPAQLRAFPTDADIPADAINAKIDETFVPVARVEPPKPAEFAATKQRLVGELRRVSLNGFPDRIEPAKLISSESPRRRLIETEPGIALPLLVARPVVPGKTKRVALVVLNEGELSSLGLAADGANASPGPVTLPDWLRGSVADDAALIVLEPRGIGATRWTKKNPPNYVERSLVLLGRTADAGRLWDIVAAARHVHRNASGAVESTEPPPRLPVEVIGRGAAGLLSAYAALLEDEIAGATVVAPPESHMAPGAPQLLNILRVADAPQWLGLLAPKPLNLHNASPELEATVKKWQAASRPE